MGYLPQYRTKTRKKVIRDLKTALAYYGKDIKPEDQHPEQDAFLLDYGVNYPIICECEYHSKWDRQLTLCRYRIGENGSNYPSATNIAPGQQRLRVILKTGEVVFDDDFSDLACLIATRGDWRFGLEMLAQDGEPE